MHYLCQEMFRESNFY
ncbi:hypothetical protein H6G02_07120 [Leptolyngbya sp. FACHB-16]|nr:hypothetical protein [Leptolyngbya sp. FACHB-8]MBD2154282.1 hypothetical protein [Leptolyngbya sp. FACHB-16]